ncbi:MAG: hypothetical protein QNK37_34390 [Acidobacteriota bacterium]|nr:hypothetical protein [Acidobacteriota bacterium]
MKLLTAAFLLAALPLWADDIIICGTGGEPEFDERFQSWGNRLKTVLVDKLGREEDQVQLLMPGKGGTLKNIRKVMDKLAGSHDKDQDLFIYLIGHGSYLREEAKLQIEGPDLSAEQLAAMLAPIPARRVVVINGASTSAAFINVLSAKDRIICTATKSVYEQNATEFMAFFIQGLEEGLADTNRDQRISVWEAAEQAAALTESFYAGEGLIATEHAILDDNGDALGTRLHLDPTRETEVRENPQADGDMAKETFIKDFTFPKTAPKQLVDDYLALMNQVEKLKDQKKRLPKAEYYDRLEKLFLKAARMHREIRTYE